MMEGRIFRKDKVFHSSNKDPKSRPCYWEVLFGVEYMVLVESAAYEARLQEALQGVLPRYGVLSLGTSDDTVWSLTKDTTPAQWIVPGQAIPLIVRPERGYHNLRPQYGYFDLTASQPEAPEEAWFSSSAVMPKTP